MNREYLRRLYDQQYAESYEEKFLISELGRADAQYELNLLSRWLKPGVKWLDVACGTGFFLSRFPDTERTGIDISPAMLEIARKANPGIRFYEGSYLDDQPQWKNRWDLVSCMWYAYGLVSSMEDLQKLIQNLAYWTSPSGRCFVPLADPRLITGVHLPHEVDSPWPGKVFVTGILWSYVEGDGAKVHAHQIAPHVDYMVELFGHYFATVEIETYPPAMPGWEGRRCALVATEKKGRMTRV
jgi:SAM-dependent methyltransferase